MVHITLGCLHNTKMLSCTHHRVDVGWYTLPIPKRNKQWNKHWV